jgi:hypothetical protein
MNYLIGLLAASGYLQVRRSAVGTEVAVTTSTYLFAAGGFKHAR